ncbi:MAG: hypothetical protein EAZ27_11300, partial [Cytophagales bacterium]
DVVTIKCISLKVMNLMPFVFFTNVHIILYQLLSTGIYLTGIKPIGFEEFEWNYNQAIEYLKSKKEIE